MPAEPQKPIKKAVSGSEHDDSDSETASSSEDQPLKKKVRTDTTKGKSKAASEKKDKDEKKPIKKDRSESPQAKRKVGAAAKYGSGPELHTDDSGDKYVELAANRRATVRAFKGKTYVDIRETYEQGGKTKPGKKGIMVRTVGVLPPARRFSPDLSCGFASLGSASLVMRQLENYFLCFPY